MTSEIPPFNQISLKTLGLFQDKQYNDNGVKFRTDYIKVDSVVDGEVTGDVIVRWEFTDIIIDGTLEGVQRDLYLGVIDSDVLEKIDVESYENYLTPKLIYELKKKRRSRLIDKIEQKAIGSPLEYVIETLFDFYQLQINSYIHSGSNKFETDMLSESDADISAILNTETGFDHPVLDRKLLVKEVIIGSLNYD